jgi:ABC-2 type transport system permease protein
MIGLGTLLSKELAEQWRTRRLLVVTIVFVVFGVASPLLARYTPELIAMLATEEGLVIEVPPPTMNDAIVQFVRNLGQTGVLAAILLAMGAVATEKERGTAAMWLTKPVTRGAFLGAKAIAIGGVLAVGMAGAGLAGHAYTTFLFDPPHPGAWVLMCLLLLLQMSAYAALTFLGSTLTRSPLAAAALGIGALTVIAIVGALPGIGAWTPSGLADASIAIAAGGAPERLTEPVVATVVLIGAALGGSWLSFRRQEL